MFPKIFYSRKNSFYVCSMQVLYFVEESQEVYTMPSCCTFVSLSIFTTGYKCALVRTEGIINQCPIKSILKIKSLIYFVIQNVVLLL